MCAGFVQSRVLFSCCRVCSVTCPVFMLQLFHAAGFVQSCVLFSCCRVCSVTCPVFMLQGLFSHVSCFHAAEFVQSRVLFSCCRVCSVTCPGFMIQGLFSHVSCFHVCRVCSVTWTTTRRRASHSKWRSGNPLTAFRTAPHTLNLLFTFLPFARNQPKTRLSFYTNSILRALMVSPKLDLTASLPPPPPPPAPRPPPTHTTHRERGRERFFLVPENWQWPLQWWSIY